MPKRHKFIGVNRVYRTKLNKKSEVDKYKANLVIKSYKQNEGIYFKEIFSLIIRHDTIRIVVFLVVYNPWPIFQLDIKSIFLHSDSEEQIYVN